MPFINDMLTDGERRPRPAQTPPNRSSRFKFEPAAVMGLLRERIVGQESTLETIEATLKIIKADIGDPERPLHVGLLLGPTGVGKTELVRVLAEAIHGRRDAICRIDMNTLAQAHYAAALTGAPPGYVGSKEGTTLLDADRIAGHFSAPGIVLFDEIEKADDYVLRALLNVFDTGWLTLTSGAKRIDFRNALIFMTSNLGAREVAAHLHRMQKGWRRLLPSFSRRRLHDIVDHALTQRFDPEFVNRIDTVSRFDALEYDTLDTLIDIELRKLNSRLARIGQQAELDASARALLRKRGFDRRYGAREMRRAFRRHVELPLAEVLADADLQKRDATRLQTCYGRAYKADQLKFYSDDPSDQS
ncbi:ATPase [Salinisphaera sp. S4-8]|uniref:AAA family ATPase n=1 Tax=Salinisphaera sp. S4-8 TaxID=633357 RepID=UPI00333E9262